MTSPHKLAAPRLRVTLERADGGAGWLELDVQTDNRDMVEWDATRGRRNWPKATDAPVLWMTFLAWHAAHRSGGDVPPIFDDFNSRCVEVAALDGVTGQPVQPDAPDAEEALAGTAGDPIRPVRATG